MAGELQLFVREALGRGLARTAIREQLLQAGWQAAEIDAALAAYAESDFPVPVPRRRPYLSAREAFLYLVLFATLYISAYNCGAVLFYLIESRVPDALHPAARGLMAREALRGAVAALLIAFPVFLSLSRYIGGLVAREPEKRGSPIRKWLTYLTLFLAALILIGDLIVLVTRLLGGEPAPRFLLKALVVFVIAAAVFGHYLGDLRREERGAEVPAPRRRALPRLAAAGMFAVLAVGLLLVGSPGHERQARLDGQRIEKLQAVADAVQDHFRNRGRLPDSLGALVRTADGAGPMPELSDRTQFTDPETGVAFEYGFADTLAFHLCAVFATRDPKGENTGSVRASGFWRHEAGRTCFTFPVRELPGAGDGPRQRPYD
jgi:hypothetical protein